MLDGFVFVGERPSPTALRRSWTWGDGRLAGKQLFDALLACGIAPEQQAYLNLFGEDGQPDPLILRHLCWLHDNGVQVVAMGKRVARALDGLGIAYRAIIHPAARGQIRLKRNYIAHVRSVLTQGDPS